MPIVLVVAVEMVEWVRSYRGKVGLLSRDVVDEDRSCR